MATVVSTGKKYVRPPRRIMTECDHCGGDGEVEVFCEDCGEELYDNTVAKDKRGGELDVCITCDADRKADVAPVATSDGVKESNT